jgi:Transposase zinc-ribbon domain
MPRPDFPKTLAEFQVRFATEDACRRYLMESRWPNGYRCPRCGQMPRPDFPKALAEFQVRFATEDACRRYLMESRWPNGYRCPRCGHADAYPVAGRGLWQWSACRYQVSVTAGTVMHRTRVPLRDWFWAAYLVTPHTPGLSAWQRQRQLGLGRYETAWTMLQKLRRAMLRPERDHIAGTVEVDEAYVGGVEEGRGGGRKRDSRKSIVVVAVEVRGRGTGQSGSAWCLTCRACLWSGSSKLAWRPGARFGRTAGRDTRRSSSMGMTTGPRLKERRRRPRRCSHVSIGSSLTSRRGSGALTAA